MSGGFDKNSGFFRMQATLPSFKLIKLTAIVIDAGEPDLRFYNR
jgi:hypothetical protein